MGGVLEKSAGDNVPPPKTEQASVPPLPPPVSPKSERSSNGPPATPRFAIRTGAPTLAVTNALVTGVLTTSPYASPASLLFQDPNISPLKDTLPPPLTAVTEEVSQPHVETKRDEQEDPANVDRLGVMGQPISNSPEGITVTVNLSKDPLVDANDVGGVLQTAGDEHQEDEVIRTLSEDVTGGHKYDVQPDVDRVVEATEPGVVPKGKIQHAFHGLTSYKQDSLFYQQRRHRPQHRPVSSQKLRQTTRSKFSHLPFSLLPHRSQWVRSEAMMLRKLTSLSHHLTLLREGSQRP
ncbi:uncharacterized protein EI90DRAFT_245383 [Cantharellus anzutake]|uniref:uncharacterized protein n=1 Tax=Cantharellus anzutake TaxID=1750568 RepID=UPI00190475EB|nr:uncharacterized protein EI90DRAFT_245383 [Cantharellus anzutake]KAF8335704.1 hypothetical protein EI90DRAFT_245383 [Cantharellus anzutake]